MLWSRRIQHYRRYRQIADVLMRHGFGFLVEQLELRHLLPARLRWFRRRLAREALSPGARLRLAFEELGPTFVKLGQALSVRADLLPADVTAELSRLEDSVPPFPADEAEQLIEAETGRPVGEIFAEFVREPIAAASIAQVHRARLPGGEEVVVKLRRPGIEASIQTDLEILRGLARLAHERLKPELFDPERIVDEFRRVILRELDFRYEARQIQRFRDRFSGEDGVLIPEVYWDYCTERMLVMAYVDGVKASRIEVLDEWGVDRRELARRGAHAFFKQVMLDGAFHGDPHPGNLLVTRDGKLAFIDFGVVGRLDETAMDALADMFVGVVRQDAERIVSGMRRLGALEGSVDLRKLRSDVRDLVERHHGRALGEIELGTLIQDVLDVTYRHRVSLPSDLLLLARALVTMEAVVRALDPDMHVIEAAEPFARRLLARRYSPDRVAAKLAQGGFEYARVLARIPPAFEEALERLNSNQMEIGFHHKGLERFITRLDIVSNRMSFALIIGALIVGSSLVIQAQVGPLLFGIPLLGFAGYFIAGVFGLGLVISIWRSGRL